MVALVQLASDLDNNSDAWMLADQSVLGFLGKVRVPSAQYQKHIPVVPLTKHQDVKRNVVRYTVLGAVSPSIVIC